MAVTTAAGWDFSGTWTTPSIIPASAPAAVPYAHVQTQYSHQSTGVGYAFTTSNVAGNMIVVCISNGLTTAPTIADSNGNSYSPIVAYTAGSRPIYIFAAFNIIGGANTVTITQAAASFDSTYSEYSGLSAVDQPGQASGSAANPTVSTTSPTTQGDEMVLGFSVNSSTSSTAGSGFTVRGSGSFNTAVAVEDKRVTATGTQTATFTAAVQTWSAAVVTFKETAG